MVLFLLIYTPSFISINILHIIGILSWIYIFLKNKAIDKIVNIKIVLNLFMIFAGLAVYISLIAIINGNSILASISFLYWIVDIIPASIMITCYIARHNYTIIDLINILLITGIIQGITALLAFTNNAIQNYFINQLISHGYDDVLIKLSSFRIYGMASNLTYSTPVTQSILAIISIYMSINRNWKYIFITPILAFSAIINARVSIIIMIIGFFCIIFYDKKLSLKKFFKIIILFITIIILINSGIIFIKNNAINTYRWIYEGYKEILMFFEGDTSYGYFNYITNTEKYPLPEGINIFFGVGQYIMGKNKYIVSSDIGYINDLWLGGILYCTILYITFGNMLINILKSDGGKYNLNRFIFLLFTITLIVSNIKGFIFSTNDFTTLLFIFYSYMVLQKHNIDQCSNDKIKI